MGSMIWVATGYAEAINTGTSVSRVSRSSFISFSFSHFFTSKRFKVKVTYVARQ